MPCSSCFTTKFFVERNSFGESDFKMTILFGISTQKTKTTQAMGVLERTCTACAFGKPWFVMFVGVCSFVVYMLDIYYLLKDKSMLTEEVWHNRVHRQGQKYVSNDMEKYWKLMFSLLGVEHALFVIAGVINSNWVLLVPWIAVDSVILILEIILFILKAIIEKELPTKAELLMLAIMLHNWTHVFCFYHQLLWSVM